MEINERMEERLRCLSDISNMKLPSKFNDIIGLGYTEYRNIIFLNYFIRRIQSDEMGSSISYMLKSFHDEVGVEMNINYFHNDTMCESHWLESAFLFCFTFINKWTPPKEVCFYLQNSEPGDVLIRMYKHREDQSYFGGSVTQFDDPIMTFSVAEVDQVKQLLGYDENLKKLRHH